MLRQLPLLKHENLIVGLETLDDAGVYRLREDLAIVNTTDVFTPIVDDPYTFGAIVVANGLSDVYAMGGTPVTALNIICFPKGSLPLEVLTEILRGGQDKLVEADVALVGGHSVVDPELKYGIAVTGVIDPQHILTNAAARPGDALILTKPLGVGIITTAIKMQKASARAIAAVCDSMTTLNRTAAEVMRRYETHACTDITGYGLLGHAREMAEASGATLLIRAAQVPLFEDTLALAQEGIFSGASRNNAAFLADKLQFAEDISPERQRILMEAETSGGLLMAVAPGDAEALLADLHAHGVAAAALIGEVQAAGKHPLRVV